MFQETGSPSRLTKASLFRRFIKLLEDPDISLIQQKDTTETQNLLSDKSNTQTDMQKEKGERKCIFTQMSQYCLAKQAAKKFQVLQM